jgi:hypothetical protein
MITKVTMTGADDSVTPSDLLKLQIKYPFVEWGILVAKGAWGKKRFPSQAWLESLVEYTSTLKLSVHLCGTYVEQMLLGNPEAIQELQYRNDIWNQFNRVQLNTHGVMHKLNVDKLGDLMDKFSDHEFIFQYDGQNDHIIQQIKDRSPNCAILYDTSHGLGRLPEQWPKPMEGVHVGYAGGLQPSNVAEHIHQIESIVLDSPIWIDAETHVRSNNNFQFDLKLVDNFLGNCERYIVI